MFQRRMTNMAMSLKVRIISKSGRPILPKYDFAISRFFIVAKIETG
jgi:hypothetical protein